MRGSREGLALDLMGSSFGCPPKKMGPWNSGGGIWKEDGWVGVWKWGDTWSGCAGLTGHPYLG